MNRPKVVTYGIASVDGRVAVSPEVLLLYGDERWQAIAGSSDVFERLKAIHEPQATLEGSGSFVRDSDVPEPLPPFDGDPQVLYQDFLPDAVLQRPGHQGWFTVVDGRGRVRWLCKEYPAEEWQGWHLLVLVAHQTPAGYLAYLQGENIPYLVAGKERVDLQLALEKMGSRLGVTCVLSTAASRLNGALLRTGLIDEVNVEFLPAVIGGFETPALFDSPALKPDEWPTRLKLISAQVQAEGAIWLRYEVVPK